MNLKEGRLGITQPNIVNRLLVVLFLLPYLYAQNPAKTVAVLDLEGRGISKLEAQTLTDRFRTSLGNTGAVRLVERNMMEEILNEQGFQQTGCTTDECAVEVGKLLGVQFMIGGAIGKIGETYTIDARMISIETGATERAREITYIGKVDGLIIEIEILAYIMAGLEPKPELLEKRRLGTRAFLEKQAVVEVKTRTGAFIRSLTFPGLGHFYAEKKKWGYGWAASELVTLGLIFVAYSSYQTAYDDYNKFTELYNNETDTELIAEYRAKVDKSYDDIESANGMIKTMTSVAVAVWISNAVHTYLIWPKKKEKEEQPTVELGYNPQTNQMQLRWFIALGD